MNMADDNDEFDQPIYEEVQVGLKRKYSDHDDAGYIMSSEVDDYIDMEDFKSHFRMWPDEESYGLTVHFCLFI